MSKAQSSESPKKDTTKKPVLGKFGNLFNSNKKRLNKSLPDSPTSPTSDRTAASPKNTEKDSVRERKRIQVSDTKVHQSSRALRADTFSDPVSKEAGLLASQTEKELTNGKSNNGLHRSFEFDPSVLETEAPLAVAEKFNEHSPAAESPTSRPDAPLQSSQKPAQSPSAKLDRQNSTDRNVRHLSYVPGRRNSATEGEANKVSTRKLQIFSQEIRINKEESPKTFPKKVSKFSGRITDSKLKITGGASQGFDSTEASHSHPQGTADGKHGSVGGISPGQSPSGREISTGTQHDKLKGPSDTLLSFDIYLSKTAGINSQTRSEVYSNGEQMEKSPGNKRTNRKRRSLKSQSSQNEEKKTETVELDEPVFDNAFEGIPDSPGSNVKPSPLLPDPNGSPAANQGSKAGANHKLSPKGDSDKSKQQHPATSPGKKKKENQSHSTSPTAHKVRDSPLKNQPAPSAKVTECNQPVVPVSTTKNAYVEKVLVSGSTVGSGGEECAERSCQTAEESTSLPADAPSDRTTQDSSQDVHPNAAVRQIAADLDSAKQKTSGPETSKSTITSKINIPFKPKNVELPIKSKGADIESTQDAAPEQNIHKGNTATKISMFENKRTSHRIDIYATKSITQPKKFVERAKLNFGRQVKGTSPKDSSPTSKQVNELKSTKLQNVPAEIKIKAEASQAEFGNKKFETKKKGEAAETVVSQEQMEDYKHDLGTVVTLNNGKTENAVPSLEVDSLLKKESTAPEVKSFESPKDSVQLKDSIITESSVVSGDDALPIVESEGRLSPSLVNSTVGISEDITIKQPTDMGNVNENHSVKEKSEPSKEVVLSDDVDSSPPVNQPQIQEPEQLNSRKEESNVETLKAYSAPKSRSPQTKTSKKKSPTKESTVNTAKKDLQTRVKKQRSETEESTSKERIDINRAVSEHAEVNKEATKHTNETPILEGAQGSDEGSQANSFLEAFPKNDVNQHSHEESSGVLPESNDMTASVQSHKEECISEDTLDNPVISASSQNPELSLTETNKEEIKLSSDDTLNAQMKEHPVESSGSTNENDVLDPEKALTVDPGINENGANTKNLDMTCASDVQPQVNDTSVVECGINGLVSPADVKQDMPILHLDESELGVTAEDKQQEDIFYDTSEHLVKPVESSFSEPDSGIEVEKISETDTNVEPDNANVISESEVNEHSTNNEYSAATEKLSAIIQPNILHEKDAGTDSENPGLAAISRVHQNGYHVDADSSPYSNGFLALEQHFDSTPNSPSTCFNISASSDEGVLDTSSDMENFAETIRKLDSPVTLPQKRKKPRAPKSPGPFCGLPPIREDYLEKILDESFSFGLGKREKNQPPMALFKLQSKATAEKMKPKRASAEQSMLLKSLKSIREPLLKPQETCDKENVDVTDLAVKRSRIDSIYSTLKSPCAARAEENVFSPSVTTVSTITTSFSTAQDSMPTGKTFDSNSMDSAAHISVLESTADSKHSESLSVDSNLLTDFAKLSLPKLPNNMEKYLELNNTTEDSPQLPGVKLPVFEKFTDINQPTSDVKRITGHPFEGIPKLDSSDSDTATKDIFYFKGYEPNSVRPDLGAQGFPVNPLEKINPRPGKIVIFTAANSEGTMIEVFTDIEDCTTWELSPTIGIKTVRGCWILYEHPQFEGRTIALEEGDLELTNPWGEVSQDENSLSPFVIGSLRHVVKDYRICQIDLFTEPEGLGVMTSYYDDTEEIQVYGRLQKTCSIKVHWGVWLIYEESDFQGIPYILEPGEYPDLSFWNTHEAYIGSMRPLKMGSRKVEIPYEPKIVVYEKPLFEGRFVEFEEEKLTLEDLRITEAGEDEPALPFTTIGSMRVLNGLWVGYEKPGFEGHQYLLEEGDYPEWSHWGGYNELLQSLRPILSDFSTPHMIMYSEKDFNEKAGNINLLGIVANMEETGFGVKIQSINVLSGVWVAYEMPDFTGEQYVLEKGMYSNFGDWGGKNFKISSVQPVLLDSVENPRGHIKVALFSEPDFQGQSQLFEGDTKSIDESFATRSCKVISGSWAVYEQEDFSGNLYVLEEGNYPNMRAMGCLQDIAIRSLKIINYEFSEPSIVLYGKENYKGRKIKLVTDSTGVQAMGYSPDLHSVEVLGGIWVLYEYSNYRGRQVFLLPSKIPKWHQFCDWNKIGSLRPLRQKRLYFKLRNKASGMLMSTNGSMDDIKLLRIQVMEDTGADDQIWVYQDRLLKCRIAEDCSLATSGTLITAGSKLGLTLEQTGACMHWTINPDGRIYSHTKPNLVLDIKGGNQYDQQHVVLNPVTEGKLTQLWEICVL
ncbi:beta/gamma crystallin domain-containing protein 1 [Discoglossus pictus]